MGIFEHFPYANYQDFNLDWVLQIVKKIEEGMATQFTEAVEKWISENFNELFLNASYDSGRKTITFSNGVQAVAEQDTVERFNLLGANIEIVDAGARLDIETLRTELESAVDEVEKTVSPSNWIGYDSFWFNGTFVEKLTIPRDRVKIATYATNGNPASPFSGGRLSVLNTAIREKTVVMINGALSGTTIIDGIVNTERRESGEAQYYLSFTEDGQYSYTSNLGNVKPTADALLAQGPYCLGVWCPVVTGGVKFDYNSAAMKADTNYDYIVVRRHPRQVLAFTDDNIYIYSCMGRNPANKGFNYDDLATLMLQERVNDAFNLDGGGSTDTVVDYRRTLPDIDKNHVGGRIGFETIGFKEV